MAKNRGLLEGKGFIKEGRVVTSVANILLAAGARMWSRL